MVKRPPTPPSPEDSQFFTVVNPYPAQPYLTMEDSKIFARWIACIVGEDNLLSFHYKPKSPRIVIIELCKDTVDRRRLLGEHRWSEVLKEPSAIEKGEVSHIFACTISKTWDLEKVRWLRRDIHESWFKNWDAQNDYSIAYPYPATRFCKPPQEDTLRTKLCLPLPVDLFMAPPAAPPSRPIHAPTPRVATEPTYPLEAEYTLSLTPSLSDRSSPEFFPPPPGLPLGPNTTILPFHGANHPKARTVSIARSPILPSGESTDEDTDGAPLWEGYGARDDGAPEECIAHGALCSSGICKICAERKRAAVLDLRMRQREEAREAWIQGVTGKARMGGAAQRGERTSARSSGTRSPPSGSSASASAKTGARTAASASARTATSASSGPPSRAGSEGPDKDAREGPDKATREGPDKGPREGGVEVKEVSKALARMDFKRPTVAARRPLPAMPAFLRPGASPSLRPIPKDPTAAADADADTGATSPVDPDEDPLAVTFSSPGAGPAWVPRTAAPGAVGAWGKPKDWSAVADRPDVPAAPSPAPSVSAADKLRDVTLPPPVRMRRGMSSGDQEIPDYPPNTGANPAWYGARDDDLESVESDFDEAPF